MDTTAIISTPESLQAKIVELQDQVDHLAKARSSIWDTKIYLERQIESFMEGLMQFVVDGEIEEATGEELAGYFNRDLTRKVSLHIRAEGDIEVVLPIGFDIDDIEGSLGVVLDTFGMNAIDVEYEDLSITDVEVQ